MASLKKNSINIIALGGQNPQILNIDFLKGNGILPVDSEPFSTLLARKEPCDEIVSVLGLTKLVIGDIEFVVTPDRFAIRQLKIDNWSDNVIGDIAIKYFKVLPYTPLSVVGINLNSTIAFKTLIKQQAFQNLYFNENNDIIKMLGSPNIDADLTLRFPAPMDSGRITMTINQPNLTDQTQAINFNYEFEYIDISTFESQMDDFQNIANYFDGILNTFVEGI